MSILLSCHNFLGYVFLYPLSMLLMIEFCDTIVLGTLKSNWLWPA